MVHVLLDVRSGLCMLCLLLETYAIGKYRELFPITVNVLNLKGTSSKLLK